LSLPSKDWGDELKKLDDRFHFDGSMITFSGLSTAVESGSKEVTRLEEPHLEQIDIQGWDNAAEFARRSAGFGIVAEGKVLSYAISNFDLSDSIEVAVWTSPDHLRKHFAYKSASALMRFCRESDIAPQWTSWSGNTAACSLARSLGFTREIAHDWAFVKPIIQA
jgi:RimJ/RimL family protein N-acetyltransferase